MAQAIVNPNVPQLVGKGTSYLKRDITFVHKGKGDLGELREYFWCTEYGKPEFPSKLKNPTRHYYTLIHPITVFWWRCAPKSNFGYVKGDMDEFRVLVNDAKRAMVPAQYTRLLNHLDGDDLDRFENNISSITPDGKWKMEDRTDYEFAKLCRPILTFHGYSGWRKDVSLVSETGDTRDASEYMFFQPARDLVKLNGPEGPPLSTSVAVGADTVSPKETDMNTSAGIMQGSGGSVGDFTPLLTEIADGYVRIERFLASTDRIIAADIQRDERRQELATGSIAYMSGLRHQFVVHIELQNKLWDKINTAYDIATENEQLPDSDERIRGIKSAISKLNTQSDRLASGLAMCDAMIAEFQKKEPISTRPSTPPPGDIKKFHGRGKARSYCCM
jgi:hypothetical protein